MDTIMTRLGKKLVLFLIFFSLGVVLIYWMLFMEINETRKEHLISVNSSAEQRNNTCLKKYFESGIDKLQHNIHTLHTLSNSKCSSFYKMFSSMYDIDVFNASQRLNQEFSKKMRAWLGGNNSMLELAEFQTVFMVHDIIMHRTTVFNPLRSKRPVSESHNSLVSYLKNISESSKANCDFCKPFNLTAEDVFGRIQGKYSVSASNAFKLAKWHSLFIPYEHSMFDIDIDIFLDMFNTSLKWFKKVHSIDRNAKYPVFFWDVFPHAGASQMHVHVHGILGERHYPGEFEDIINAVQTYHQTHNVHYWNAVIDIHEFFDLTLRFGKSVIIAPLVPRREHELWLLSNEPSSEFYILLFSIISMYQEKMERYCFSLAGALPVLDERVLTPESSLPAIIFIGTRGDCSSSVSDVSSLELYLFNNVNTDPYKTITTLRQYLKVFSSQYKINDKMKDLWSNVS